MDTIHIPENALIDVCRTNLIRQWWYTYNRLLRGERVSGELNSLTVECERRKIVVAGRKMPRDGADDLASIADELRRKRRFAH